MGCVHSASERVETVTTSDELARPPRSASARQEQIQNNAGYPNNNLGPLNAVPAQADAAPSSDSRAARHPVRSSSRDVSQQDDGLPESSRPTHSGQVVPTAKLSDPAGAPVSVGAPSRHPTPERPDGAVAAAPISRDAAPESHPAGPQPSGDAAAQTLTSPLPAPSAPPPLPQQQQPPAEPAGQITAALPALKELLARISVPAQPAADDRNWVLIVWDIENVRCPGGDDPLLTPAKVLGYIKAHFIQEPGRVEYRTVAAVTPKSLRVIHKSYADFVEQMVPELTLLVASADEPKRNADVMLKKELYRFVSEHSHIARHRPGQLTVVLISGDEDFLEPVQVALNSGFCVELLHHESPSWALRNQQGYAREPLLWSDFLKKRSGAQHVNLPYNHR